MSEVHRCPICNGTGLVSRPPHIAGDVNAWSDSGAGPYNCRACSGSGVIVIPSDYVPFKPVWECDNYISD